MCLPPGQLSVGYLGTKPPSAAIGGVKRDLDYDKLDEEHRKLLQVGGRVRRHHLFSSSLWCCAVLCEQVIRDMQSEHKAEPNEALSIKSQVPRVLDRAGGGGGEGSGLASFRPPEDAVRLFSGVGGEHLVQLTVRLFVSYSGALPATNVNISVTSPPFLHCLPSNIVLQQVMHPPG